MTDFAPDRPNPPRQFRPGPGQLGYQAAVRGLRGRGQTIPRGRQRGQAQPSQPHLGLPEETPQPLDLRHLEVALKYANAKTLGRDIPLGIWLLRNGYHDELFQNGEEPVDWLYL